VAATVDDFSGTTSTDGFWRSAEADTAMQRGNLPGWRALAELVAGQLPAASVLDIGCNQGGFLRYLYQDWDIAQGYGFDPAPAAIEAARALNDGWPIEYASALRPPTDWPQFDLCFSQEVIYLIPELAEHADDVWRALRPGGTYLAVTCVHARSAYKAKWHSENAQTLNLPPLRRVEDYLAPFLNRGFRAELGRLPVRSIPVDPGRVDVAYELLEFWTQTSDKILFRFDKPRN
jgi:SAM-dependent methyltransferase